jgi:exonuclease VII large subunit
MKFRFFLLIPLSLPLFCASVLAQEVTLSREDRDRLVRIEEKLEAFIDSTNQRFEDLHADMNARFEQVDKRFEELRADMNARFKQVDQRFAELRADMNTRFKQVDKRFEEQQSFLQMIVAAFAGLVAVVIGFALWDRRTMIKAARQELQEKLEQYSVQREQQIVKRAVEESYERIEARGLPRHFVTLLRERASHDPELSGELKNLGLL